MRNVVELLQVALAHITDHRLRLSADISQREAERIAEAGCPDLRAIVSQRRILIGAEGGTSEPGSVGLQHEPAVFRGAENPLSVDYLKRVGALPPPSRGLPQRNQSNATIQSAGVKMGEAKCLGDGPSSSRLAGCRRAVDGDHASSHAPLRAIPRRAWGNPG